LIVSSVNSVRRDTFVNSSDAVSDQISKFFLSHREESKAGQVGVMEFKVRKGNYKRGHGGTR
jgi:hypothetical protein